MTDVTELALRLKLEAHRAVSNFNPQMNIKTRDLKELVEALEKAQRANGYLREQSAEWERKAISNFQECAKMSERIHLLESRAVKLPESFKLAKSSSGLRYFYADEVDAALAVAGIKVEAE